MKEISGHRKNSNYYRVYDNSGKLKGIIAKEKEKNLNEAEWLKGVSCFVINENGEVLIEKRVNKGLTPGKLDLCSGHIDGKETETQAMIRELKEELGIEIEEAINVIKLDNNAAPLEFVSSNKKRKFFITFYCLKRKTSKVKIQNEEIEKVEWLPLDETLALIRSGRTKFPKDFNYEEIFRKLRDAIDNKREIDVITK